MRQARILMHGRNAGILAEEEEGYTFAYNAEYLEDATSESVSLTLQKQKEPFKSKTLFPFFDGLIPEGWLLHIIETNWKVNPKDRMGLLLVSCRDTIGAVTVEPEL